MNSGSTLGHRELVFSAGVFDSAVALKDGGSGSSGAVAWWAVVEYGAVFAGGVKDGAAVGERISMLTALFICKPVGFFGACGETRTNSSMAWIDICWTVDVISSALV